MDRVFPKVLQAVPADNYAVCAYMNDGTMRQVDVRPLIEKGGVFAPLRDAGIFCSALTVMNDTVAWDITGKRDPSDCIDLDPFTIMALPMISPDDVPKLELASGRAKRNDIYTEIQHDA